MTIFHSSTDNQISLHCIYTYNNAYMEELGTQRTRLPTLLSVTILQKKWTVNYLFVVNISFWIYYW